MFALGAWRSVHADAEFAADENSWDEHYLASIVKKDISTEYFSSLPSFRRLVRRKAGETVSDDAIERSHLVMIKATLFGVL